MNDINLLLIMFIATLMLFSIINCFYHRCLLEHTYRLQPTTAARSHFIIFHRCNFSSFSRQFGRASRGKYPRGLRSPCKINNPSVASVSRFVPLRVSRVCSIFIATKPPRYIDPRIYLFLKNCMRFYFVHF